MKKTAISFMLVLAMVLAMVLVPAPAAEAAGAKHEHTAATNHCVCGATSTDGTNWTGGAAGIKHTCAAVTDEWKPFTATADTIPAGNYYLTGNVQITKRFLVSSGTVTICLNGYDIVGLSTGTKEDDKRCFVVNGGTLNVCDCQGGGEISSTSTSKGALLYLLSKDAATANLYSGTLVGSPNATAAGGTIRLDKGTCSIYNAVIKNGKNNASTNCWGGNVYISDGCTMNMYGGIIQDGVVSSSGTGGNVCVNGSNSTFNMTGGAIIGGTVARTGNGGTIKIQGGYMQLAADFYAVAKTTDSKGEVTINSTNDLVIDLNGNKLAGEATVKAGDKKLSIVDTTAAKGEAGTGLVSSTVQIDGTLAQGKPLPACAGNKAGQRYVAISNEAGSVVPHRIYVGFDKIQLYKDDNGNIGMNYVTNFVLDDEVKALLVDDVDGNAAGCCFGVGDPELRMGETVGLAKAAYKADIATNIAAILDGEGDATAIATKIYANTFVNLNIGGQTVTVTSNTYGYSLQDVVDALNGIADLANQNAAAAELLADIKSRFN